MADDSTSQFTLERLNDRVNRLTAESTQRKQTIRNLKAELEKITAERDELSKAKAPPEAEELNRLRTELRTVKHLEGFRGLIGDKELKLNGQVKPERLMALIGYAPESDDFDAKTVKKQIEALKESDPYLFTEADTPSAAEPAGSQKTPDWASRGVPQQPGERVTLTSQHLRDPVFMLTQFQDDAAK